MARLTSNERSKLPSKDFAGPNRSFPVENRSHAIAAERMVGRSVAAGNITPAQAAQIKAKAKAVLGKGR